MRARLFMLLCATIAAGSTACKYDPAPQQIIDGLGDETGSPNAAHRPGQPCLACHSTYGGADPPLAIGGTVYTQDDAGNLIAAPKVLVTVTDSTGDTRMACTGPTGNFFFKKDAWSDIAFPLSVTAGDRSMRSIIGRDGSCGSCHKPPKAGALDAGIGAGPDTPGAVVVAADATDPSCGGGP